VDSWRADSAISSGNVIGLENLRRNETQYLRGFQRCTPIEAINEGLAEIA